jgi:DNA-binding LacI/PurR family transcriptional regulator
MNKQAHVRPEVRDKVLQAAEELGYKPSWAAKSLRSQRGHAMALIVPDIANPYYIEIYKGIQSVVNARGYLCFLLEGNRFELEEHGMTLKFDGIILGGSPEDRLLTKLEELNLPVVRLDAVPPVPSKLRYIAHELDSAMNEAIDVMVGFGHRRFGMITWQSDRNHRVKICREALRRHGIKLDEEDIATFTETNYHYGNGAAGMQELLRRNRGITALITNNDLIAIGSIAEAAKHGISVPNQLSILGCDDIVASQYSVPPLSTIKLFKEQQGKTAARLLLELIEGEESTVPAFTCMKTRFVNRGSIGPVWTYLEPVELPGSGEVGSE